MGLDSVELVIAAEEALSITIDDGEAATIQTPRMLIDLATEKLQGRMTRAEVAQIVKKVVIDTLGIRERDYHEDADFIKDFHID
jgi:acyl carrier protein